MILKEDNLSDIMNELYLQFNDWVKVWDEINLKVKDSNQPVHNSIQYNYNPIFVFELIEKQINLNEFKKTIAHIYNNITSDTTESLLYRFFDESSDITLNQYLKNKNENIKQSIWTDLGYAFLDIKNEKLIINRNNLPYFKACLAEISEEKIKGLYYGKFAFFCYNFRFNIDELSVIFQLAKENIAFNKKEAKEYKPFVETMIDLFASDSYEQNQEHNLRIYHFLKRNVTNFEEKFFNVLCSKDDFSNKNTLKLNFGAMNFAHVCNIEVIPYINQIYTESLNKFRKNLTKPINWQSKSDFDELVTAPFMHSLRIALEKNDFSFDVNKIDIAKPHEDNFIYLKLLEIKIEQNQYIEISQPIRDYIREILENVDDNINLFREFTFGNKLMIKYMDYIRLESNVSSKNEKLKISRNKI